MCSKTKSLKETRQQFRAWRIIGSGKQPFLNFKSRKTQHTHRNIFYFAESNLIIYAINISAQVYTHYHISLYMIVICDTITIIYHISFNKANAVNNR